ncbi:MAG: flagellar hook-length control protein FliK [Planctomycetota bacterium]|jgi:flagellar hook-length control protein FliK
MSTPLPTLVSAAGNLTLDSPRPQPRTAAPETSFSRTLSRKRDAEPDPEPRAADAGPGAQPPARAPDPGRRAASPDAAARDAEAPDPARGTAQSTDPDAQEVQGQAAPGADDGRPQEPTATDASSAPATAATGAPEAGSETSAANQMAALQQASAAVDASPQAAGSQAPAEAQAPAGSQASTASGVRVETGPQTADIPTPVQAPARQENAPGTGGDQPRPEGRANADAQGDGKGQQLKAGTGLEGGKGFAGASETGTPGNPALGRAVQVQSAVQVENITGHAPVAPAMTAAATVANVPATVGDGQGPAPPNAQSQDQPNQFVNRVVRGLSAMINQRGGVLNMRLQPPELGQLRVQMTIARGVVTAQFQPATTEVQALLDRSLGTLRTALESHGLAVERLSVQSVQQAGGPTTRDAAEEQTHQQRHHADAGEGRSRGRGDGQGETTPRRFSFRDENEFEMPEPVAVPAGADES